jgi:hypothetical protein
VIERIEVLPDERQQQAASLLLDFLEVHNREVDLTPEQRDEIAEALSDAEPLASKKKC